MDPLASNAIEITVIVPAFNERDNIDPLLAELRAAFATTGRTHEILLVDDGSDDGTAVRMATAAKFDPRVRAVLLERRCGQSAAIAAGFARSRGRVIVTLDADLQNDPADLPRLLAALEHADVVSGIRERRRDDWSRRWSSRLANSARRAMLGDTITDIGCSFKAYRREALENLPWFVGIHRFLPALCQLRGGRLAEVPVTHRPRLHGVSKYGVSNRLWRGLRDLWGVRWLKTRLIRYSLREVDP